MPPTDLIFGKGKAILPLSIISKKMEFIANAWAEIFIFYDQFFMTFRICFSRISGWVFWGVKTCHFKYFGYKVYVE